MTPRGGGAPRYRPGSWGNLSELQKLEICLGALLTQNTNWSNAEKALVRLNQEGLLTSLPELSRISQRKLAGLIRSSGYFNQKAVKIKAFARHVLARGSLSRWLSAPLAALRNELLSLHGIGPETADSILLYAGGRPSFVVDAYTLRIGSRLGWFKQAAGYHDARSYLASKLPRSPRLYAEFHALLVALAKHHCRITPLCAGCPLSALCLFGKSQLSRA